MCGLFKKNCLGLQKFLLLTQSLLVFATRSCGDLPFFLALEPWAWGPGMRLGLFAPEISLPNFYVPHMGEGLARSMSAPLLPVWMDVVS